MKRCCILMLREHALGRSPTSFSWGRGVRQGSLATISRRFFALGFSPRSREFRRIALGLIGGNNRPAHQSSSVLYLSPGVLTPLTIDSLCRGSMCGTAFPGCTPIFSRHEDSGVARACNLNRLMRIRYTSSSRVSSCFRASVAGMLVIMISPSCYGRSRVGNCRPMKCVGIPDMGMNE